MNRLEGADRFSHFLQPAQLHEGVLVIVFGQRKGTRPMGGQHVEQRLGRSHGLLGLFVCIMGFFYLRFGGVRGARQAAQRFLGPSQQLFDLAAEQARRLRVGVGLECGHRLVEAAHPGEAVAAHQVVVEERQRQAGDEGVHPDSQAGQLHRHPVQVHSVHAVPGDRAAQEGSGLDLGAGLQLAQRFERRFTQAVQLVGHGRDGVQGQPGREFGLDAVEGRHQEVARPHGDVGASEVEEGPGQCGFIAHLPQPVEPGDVAVQRRFQGVVQQVLHGEGLGEVAAGGLAHPRPVVEEHRPRFYLHRVVLPADGDVHLLALDLADGEVVLRHGQTRLEEPFVDGSELAHRQRPEIDRALLPVGAPVDEQARQGRGELGVGEPQGGQRRPRRAHVRVLGEEAAVVGGHPPADVSMIDRPPELPAVVPEDGGLLVVAVPAGAFVLQQPDGHLGEGVVAVVVVAAVREELLVLGVGHEEQPEQDHHDLFVGPYQFLVVGVRTHPGGDRLGQGRDGLEVDPLPQPLGQLGGEPGGAVQYLLQRPAAVKGLGREEHGQVSGLVLGQQGQVQLHEGLGPALAPHAGVGAGGVEAYLRGAGQDHPVDVLLVGDGQPLRHGGGAVEALRRGVEHLVLIAEHGHGPAAPFDGEHPGVDAQVLHSVPQPLHQPAAPRGEQGRGTADRIRPFGHLRHPGPQLPGGQQPGVAEAGRRGVQLRQGRQQEPGGGVVAGLVQRHAGQPLHLRGFEALVDHRVFAGRPAQRHPHPASGGVGIEDGQQHRAGPPRPAPRPRPAQIGRKRPGGRLGQAHLQPARLALRVHARRGNRRREPLRRRPADGVALAQKIIGHASHGPSRPPGTTPGKPTQQLRPTPMGGLFLPGATATAPSRTVNKSVREQLAGGTPTEATVGRSARRARSGGALRPPAERRRHPPVGASPEPTVKPISSESGRFHTRIPPPLASPELLPQTLPQTPWSNPYSTSTRRVKDGGVFNLTPPPNPLVKPYSTPNPGKNASLGSPARTRKTPPPRPASRAQPPPPPPACRTRSVSTPEGRVRRMIPVSVCGPCGPEVLSALPLIQHRCDIVNTLVRDPAGFFCHSVIQAPRSPARRAAKTAAAPPPAMDGGGLHRRRRRSTLGSPASR